MIRVLRVITWLPVGGIERKIVEVLPRLDRERFEVSLVCLRERGPLADELEAAGIGVELIPFRKRWDWAGLKKLAELMRRKKIDVVHSHMYRSNVPATVAARMAGVRRVWCQVHNVHTWESARQRMMDRFLCRWREGMIAVSEQVRRDVIHSLRLPPEKVRLIYNGVDLSRFGRDSEAGRAARGELRQQENAGESDLVFLFAARMVEQKRPQDFLELARYLMTKDLRGRRAPGLQFWLLGDGPMLGEMRSMAAGLPDPFRVKFFGRRGDVERFMAAADFFIMTSTKEGFSNALLEAMASGLAVVATNVGGNAEAIRECQDGRVIEPLQPDKLHSAVDRLLGDMDLRLSFARSAEDRARGFSLEAMVGRVQDLYHGST